MRVITLDKNKVVISVKDVLNSYELQTDDIVSDLGEINQIMQSDGTFITPEPVAIEPSETVEQKLVRLESMNTMLNEDFAGLVDTLIETGVLV